MTTEPPDPFESPWPGGQALTIGRQLHEALLEQPHYQHAARLLDRLDADDLRRLAFYVAAEKIATDAEAAQNGDYWLEWWRGIDSADPDASETTPRQLWKIMRPEGD